MQISKFHISCPQWALPREAIPMHVQISKAITPRLAQAKIDLPVCFELVDLINIQDYKMSANKIIVRSIGKTDKSAYDYFGIVIATKEPFDELKKQIPIEIEFEYNDKTSEKTIQYARIFRPLLEFKQTPSNIVLTDSKMELKLPISMKFTGFGEISMRPECRIEGEIVSTGTSILDELLRRIVSEGIIDEEADSHGVTVNKKYVNDMIVQLKDEFSTDEDAQRIIREYDMDEETADLLYKLTRESKEKFMDVFYKTVEGYLIQIVSEILQRNIGDNVQVESQTKIQTLIKIPSTNVTIRFLYKDNVGNEYSTAERTIKIIDKRSDTVGPDVEIPLEIIHLDETGAYKNVETMNIGTNG